MWASLGQFVLGHCGYLLAFAVLFASIETLWPAAPEQRRWRKGTATDLTLSVLNPVLVQPANHFLLAIVLGAALSAVGVQRHERAQAVVATYPFWFQLLAAMIVAEFVAYWKHRIFHMKWLWPIHAVHHSATEVDWLTNERDHPLQLLATYFFMVTSLVLTGFSAEIIALQGIIRRVYSLYTHANVRWSYGPLNRIFVSPAVHRWHHARDARTMNKNFAVFLSIFDVLFGTYLVPDAETPERFGLLDREMGNGILAALGHPLTYLKPPA